MVIGNNREEERSIQSKLSNIPMSTTISIFTSLKNEIPMKTGDRHICRRDDGMEKAWNVSWYHDTNPYIFASNRNR